MQGLRRSCHHRPAEPAPIVSANSKRRRLGHRVLLVFLSLFQLFLKRIKRQIRGYFLGHYEIRGYTTRDPGVLFETLHGKSTAV